MSQHLHLLDEYDANGAPIPKGPYDTISTNHFLKLKKKIVVTGIRSSNINVAINLTASRDVTLPISVFDQIISRIELDWNTSRTKGNTTISIRTKITKVSTGIFGNGGDILIEGITQGHSNAKLGGRKYQHNHMIRRKNNTINPWSRIDTASHEFGHLIGLSHRANNTNSLMSYALNRELKFEGLKLIADRYGH